MAPEMDQFYRSTMAIYKSIMEQFNPALENLVYLGNNYLRAFHALSEAAEVYFNAIQKIGEQALQSSTSQILGEILVQMSDTQRHLNSDLEVVVQTFHGDLLQHMEKNTKLDMQFIKDSRQHYEMEYRHRAANLEKCMSELWRMERKRDKNVREMKESVNRLHAQMQAFVSESQRAAELEEKRRYRFLAEKHLLLSNTFLQFFGRVSGGRGDSQRSLPRVCGLSAAKSYPSGPLSACSQLPPTAPSRLLPPRLSQAPSQGMKRVTTCPWTHCFPPWTSVPPKATPPLAGHEAGWLDLNVEKDLLEGLNELVWAKPAERGLAPSTAQGLLSGVGFDHCCWAVCSGDPLPAPSRSGWFPEAYVKPLEEAPVSPMNPMSPMNELPSRYLGGQKWARYWDGQARSRTPSRVPSCAPSPAPTPLPDSRRSSMGSPGVAGDVKKLMSWEQHPPELFPR
uniref:BAR/IMD domain containing adaptor protein 2 like 2 n=1 Tax=Ursus maritimus TaxID=29073 RepID=A0A452UI63_URSMA